MVFNSSVLLAEELYRGTVQQIVSEQKEQISETESIKQQYIKVKLQDKTVIDLVHAVPAGTTYKLDLKQNDKVILHKEGELYYIDSYKIEHIAYILLALFVILILAVGRLKGLFAILSLVVQGGLLCYFLIPMLKAGHNPLVISSIFCTSATLLTMILISGFNKKTLAATLGTTFGVILAGILGIWAVYQAKMTGLLEQEMQSIFYQFPQINIQGLIASGILIGSLGAAMDVAMSIASSLAEIRETAPDKTFKELYNSGMNIGRDIMGTMVNTLILAYAGGSLAMIILFTLLDFELLINSELLMGEIILAIVGSIGLILTIPVTAGIASYLYSKK